MKVSIITPSFNRAGLLQRLYYSLLNQTCHNFEWLIVDDGSTDNTVDIVNNFSTNKFEILYIKKINGGKHTAINEGLKVASGEYVYVVDSDDWLPINAIEILISKIIFVESISGQENIGGLCGLKSTIGGIVGNQIAREGVYNYLDFRYKFKITGDKAEVFKKSVLEMFFFPEFEGEKFCPEALILNRISKKFNFYFFNDVVYFCEYQNDGLSSKIYQIRKQSPKATLLYYEELFNSSIPLYYKIRALLNYLRFLIVSKF